jgi:signal transduction histidine kinase
MRDLGRVFSDNGSLGEKLAAFLRRIQMLKPVEACYFSLFDRDHVNLHAVATYHLQESTRRMPPALEQKVAERATPVCIPDLAGDVFNSYLGLPLLRRGAVIAVLNLCARTPAAFSRKNVEFFTAVTEHTALLLDNAWLMEETQKQVDELTFVFRFSGILRREKTLASVMEAVLEQCIQSVQADLGYLLAFEPESAALKVLATSHEGRPAPPEGMVLPLKAADLAYSEDPRQDFPALLAPACLGPLVEGMARLLLVPLCTDRGLHAVMLVGHRLSGHMEEREHRLVMILTNAAENAIGRAMADEEMQARIREEAASRAKSEFLAVMSHELRTPLTSILGFTELLAENHFGPTNDKQQEYLQQVLGSGRHLLLLINDILDLAKVESGKMTLTLEEVDLQSFLEEVQRSFAPLVHRKNLTLRTHMGPALSPVTADPVRLKQIMYNLVSNAVKFTDSGGVEVLVRAEGGCVHIEVSDTGIGIPREEQDIIFRPFSQGSRRPGRVQEGTGLGLSLSRRLAELHGGTLTVVSEVGVGSTFHVVLPQGLRP